MKTFNWKSTLLLTLTAVADFTDKLHQTDSWRVKSLIPKFSTHFIIITDVSHTKKYLHVNVFSQYHCGI